MTQTSNLGLYKPDSTDYVDVSVLNNNMDILDADVKIDAVQYNTAQSLTSAQQQQARENIGAVGNVNGKTGDTVTLNASDVGARADNWMPTAADVGAVSNSISTASITFTNATNASNTILQKQGRLVVGQLVGRVNASVAAASFLNNWMNLPSGFAPPKSMIFPIAFGAEDLRVYVNTDGAVNLYNGTSAALSTTKTMNFVVTYMA